MEVGFGEVRAQWDDLDARIVGGQHIGCGREHLGADIHGNVGEPPGVGGGGTERVEQQPGLGGGARTQLDHHFGMRGRHDVGRMLTQDRGLATRRIVLGKPGDLIEEPASALIVEPLGRQRRRVLPQTPKRVRGKSCRRLLDFGTRVVALGCPGLRFALGSHRASRSPENTHRDAAGKKLR